MRRAFIAFAVLSFAAASLAEEPAAPALQFFESKVRPLLVTKCQECHGEAEQNANLRLDSLGAVLGGGDSGPAIVAGKPEQSLLVKAISHTDANLQMPPDGKLSDPEIATLTEWIKLGAPWPGSDPAATPQTPRKEFKITDEDRAFWAFQPLAKSEVGGRTSEVGSAIDSLIIAKLTAKGITPNGAAGRRELIRRASFDLVGLPPTPEEVDTFVADESPDAYARLVDRLLDSPRYGERWGRHWLDLVRFGETNGYERDDAKPEVWRYRDYVIRSFNEDKPYDQFIREQLAGDEMIAKSEVGGRKSEGANAYDPLVATGFYRVGVYDDEPDDKAMAEFDDLDDVVTAVSHAFLGITINCARCHDHKFDPISQADYYSMLAFFRGVRRYEPPRYAPDSATLTPLRSAGELTHWRRETEYAVAEVQAAIAAEPNQENRSKLAGYSESIAQNRHDFQWALVVRERGKNAPPTHVLVRGSAATPAAQVEPAFPTVFAAQAPNFPQLPDDVNSSGRRSALADWIASPQNPLTARVMVNRLWQHHFGRGIVPTPNDFGRTGMSPTNSELLDWLASEFIRSGWSLKHMHRKIMLTDAYRRSSSTDNPTALAADESNTLVWRQNLRRIQAEAMRDSMLFVAGRLNVQVGGPSIMPTLPPEVLATQSRPGSGWSPSEPDLQRRRSVYIFVKRSLLVPLLENFDYTNTASPAGDRPTTTVAPQALMLLNNAFVREQAAALANRVEREAGGDALARIDRLFALTLARKPTAGEQRIALDVLERQRTESLLALAQESGSRDPVTDGAVAKDRSLRSLCLMLLNLNEFLYVD